MGFNSSDKMRIYQKENKHHRVVILGAGFGGLWSTKTLVHYPIDICLIDKNNYHTFFPLLYQVAAAELEPEDIVYPVKLECAQLVDSQLSFCTFKVNAFSKLIGDL